MANRLFPLQLCFAALFPLLFCKQSVSFQRAGFILGFICPVQMSLVYPVCGIYFSETIPNLTVNALSNLFHFICVLYCCPVVTELLINGLNVTFKTFWLKFTSSFSKSKMETPTLVFLLLPLLSWQLDPIVDHIFPQHFSFHFGQFGVVFLVFLCLFFFKLSDFLF